MYTQKITNWMCNKENAQKKKIMVCPNTLGEQICVNMQILPDNFQKSICIQNSISISTKVTILPCNRVVGPWQCQNRSSGFYDGQHEASMGKIRRENISSQCKAETLCLPNQDVLLSNRRDQDRSGFKSNSHSSLARYTLDSTHVAFNAF